MNFDIKELPNFKFSHQKLLNYYNEVVEKFQHLKWTPTNIDTMDHNVSKVYSWAIQSNLKDPKLPCPPYDIKHDDDVTGDFQTPTELLYGPVKIIVDAFPDIRQTVISAHPPGTLIKEHVDNDEFIKIHIPIITNKQSYFTFTDKKYNLEIGKAYLINTTLKHGTINEGDNDRVHLIFKLPVEHVDLILSNNYILDKDFINFECLELNNLKFNYDDLLSYYSILERDYQYLKWTMPEIPGTNLKGIYGYGILTNKENIDEPSDPPGTRMDKKQYDPLLKPTKMLFGFGRKIYDSVPYLEELGITAHPPNSGIPPHVDKDEHIRVHLPIQMNMSSEFVINNNTYVLETKKAYLINTKITHSTYNKGNSDRIHLLFKIPIGKIEQFMKTEIIL